MRFLLLIYTDPALLDAAPAATLDADMKRCLLHADGLTAEQRLISFEQLEPPASARSVRVRGGRAVVLDGPFAETKEVLAGFNVVEAESMEEAVRMAQEFPWARYGCIEVRPVVDIAAVRARVGA